MIVAINTRITANNLPMIVVIGTRITANQSPMIVMIDTISKNPSSVGHHKAACPNSEVILTADAKRVSTFIENLIKSLQWVQ